MAAFFFLCKIASCAEVLIGDFTYINFISYRFLFSVSIVDFSRSVVINIQDTWSRLFAGDKEEREVKLKYPVFLCFLQFPSNFKMAFDSVTGDCRLYWKVGDVLKFGTMEDLFLDHNDSID